MTDTKTKIMIAKEVLGKGMTIKMTALKWAVSPTTVRNYMDLYTEGKLKLNLLDELGKITLSVNCATMDDKDTLERRMKQLDSDLRLLMSQLEKEQA